MRAVAACFLFMTVGLAGCVDDGPATPHAETRSPHDALPGIWRVVGDRLEPWMGGALTTDGQGNHGIDVRSLLRPDAVNIVLVEALADVTLRAWTNVSVQYNALPEPAGEERSFRGKWIRTMSLIGPYGGDLLARALDKEAGFEDNMTRFGHLEGRAHSANFDGPRSFTTSKVAMASLAGGDWYTQLDLTSQVPQTAFQDSGNSWTLDLKVDGAHRIILLPPAPARGVAGLNDLEGGTTVSFGVAEAQFGGELVFSSPYGATLEFCHRNPEYGTAGQEGRNAATLVWGEDRIPLDVDASFSQQTRDQPAFGIQVDEWWGWPLFVAVGLPSPAPLRETPLPPYRGLMHGGFCHDESVAPA